MNQISDVSIGVETEEGVRIILEGEENIEAEDGSQIPIKSRESFHISRSKAKKLSNEIEQLINRETLVVNGKTKIMAVETESGMIAELYIEPYNFPSNIELGETHSIKADMFELGTDTSGSITIQDNIHYNISDIEGSAFEITSENEQKSYVNMYCGTICPRTKFKENADLVEDVSNSDTREYGKHFDLPVPGCYRVWVTKTKIESN